MAKVWLSGIAEVKEAFSSLPAPNDADVAQALTVLRASESNANGMGFHGLKNDVQELVDAQRILTEHGLELDSPQMQQLVKHAKEIEERRRARSRFWVQVAVSVPLAAVALAILGLASPSAELVKGLCGLLGAVIGYWLR